MARPIALLKVGRTSDAVADERGDYDVWFREGLESDDLVVLRVADGDPLPDPSDYGAVVMTGSFAMVTDRAPWSVSSGGFLARSVELGLPVLAVCYGHQLLADALGGTVDWNPAGRQIGTVEARLTDEGAKDPLFAGLGNPLVVQTSHRQVVTALPKGATLLASSPRDPNHAFRFGPNAWGVQFHPEFDDDVARAYIEERAEAIASEGGDPKALLDSVRRSSHGREILRRFGAIARGERR